ncbi:MAG: PHP domain-containing protein [Bacillota bacterium]
MKYYGDYHTHSRYSDGQEKVERIAEAARRQGLSEVAVTDHGPNVLVSGVKNLDSYQQLLEEIESLEIPEIRVLAGAEANIIDLKGMLDIPPPVYEKLDVLICGLHPYSIPGNIRDGYRLFGRNHLRHLSHSRRQKAVNANTKATVAALENNPVDILSHPGLFFEVDMVEVSRACIREEVLFEINCGHHHPELEDVETAFRVGVEFIINSDAHFYDTVGELEYGSRLVKKLGIPAERIVNCCRVGGDEGWIGKRRKSKHW